MIHSENNVGFLSVSLAFRLSSWTVFYAKLPFPLMTATNVQGFKARGKAFGIVVTTLLSSRLHLIPSPAGKHYELYSVLILFPPFPSSFFSLHFSPLFPFGFPRVFPFPAGTRCPGSTFFPPLSDPPNYKQQNFALGRNVVGRLLEIGTSRLSP